MGFLSRVTALLAALLVLPAVPLALSDHGETQPITPANARCERPRPTLPGRGSTPLTWPEKQDKTWPSHGPLPKRLGLEPATTTLFNVHSREAVPLFSDQNLPLTSLRHLTACRGFGFEQDLDPKLFQAAFLAAQQFQTARIELISGYRSPKFNDTLAKKGRAVASESRHTRGQALDMRLCGVPATEVGAWLFLSFDGGVGTYVRDDFVHIDVGPKRSWRSR